MRAFGRAILLAASLAGTFLWLGSCEKKAQQQAQVPPTVTKLATPEQDKKRIDSLETLIKASIQRQEQPDVKLSMHAIQAYEYYAHDYPQDTLSPYYLYKAAQNYEGVLHDYPKAIKTYQQVYDQYPKFRKRGMMLFHEGNLYHELQDTANAIRSLQRFVDEYPQHAFADDATQLIRYIKMSEKEREQFFRKADERARQEEKAQKTS